MVNGYSESMIFSYGDDYAISSISFAEPCRRDAAMTPMMCRNALVGQLSHEAQRSSAGRLRWMTSILMQRGSLWIRGGHGYDHYNGSLKGIDLPKG